MRRAYEYNQKNLRMLNSKTLRNCGSSSSLLSLHERTSLPPEEKKSLSLILQLSQKVMVCPFRALLLLGL